MIPFFAIADASVSILEVLASTPRIASAILVALVLTPFGPNANESPSALAHAYSSAIQKLNEAHLRKPQGEDEAALAKKLPKDASKALDALLAVDSAGAASALVECGEAALDLDRIEDFELVHARLAKIAPAEASKLGIALSKPRYLMRGLDGVEKEGLAAVGSTLDEVLAAYDETFAFFEWSKVPGKKLRIRVHLVPKITDPPHFGPEFPFHSEIDFPVIDAKAFSSPTADSKFMLYGLCHELGHVIAMWGDATHEEDHHTWAHYTGVTIVEHLAQKKKEFPVSSRMQDVRWQSLGAERKRLADPSTRTDPKLDAATRERNARLALFIALHDLVGAKSIGEAINALDKEDKRLRINRVRYYGFDAFEKALVATTAGKKHAKEIAALFHR